MTSFFLFFFLPQVQLVGKFMATQLKVNFAELASFIFILSWRCLDDFFHSQRVAIMFGKLSNFANVCILAIAMISEIKRNIDDL
jgi:hypothetical protein